MITQEQLIRVTNCNPVGLGRHYSSLVATCEERLVNTPFRIAAFLANAIHETNGFRAFVENLNYSAEGLVSTWPNRFTLQLAKEMERKPELIANHVYGKRFGNDNPGDGWRYRGRGIFQTTFKDNYKAVSSALGYDFVSNPDALAEAPFAAKSAGFYWHVKGLNNLADKGDLIGITKAINGGLNGHVERVRIFNMVIKLLT